MGSGKYNGQEMEKSRIFSLLGSCDFFELNLHNEVYILKIYLYLDIPIYMYIFYIKYVYEIYFYGIVVWRFCKHQWTF